VTGCAEGHHRAAPSLRPPLFSSHVPRQKASKREEEKEGNRKKIGLKLDDVIARCWLGASRDRLLRFQPEPRRGRGEGKRVSEREGEKRKQGTGALTPVYALITDTTFIQLHTCLSVALTVAREG